MTIIAILETWRWKVFPPVYSSDSWKVSKAQAGGLKKSSDRLQFFQRQAPPPTLAATLRVMDHYHHHHYIEEHMGIIIIIILMGHYHHHHCFDKTYCWSSNVLHLQKVHISPLSTLWVLECVCHFRRLQLPPLSESWTPYVPTAALFFCIAEHWTV